MARPKLDWRKSPDRRNLLPQHQVSTHLPDEVDLDRIKLWRLPYVRSDQGQEGACVGFGTTNELLMSPFRVRPPGYDRARGVPAKTAVVNAFARGVYHRCLQIDEFPGEADEGTSVNAGGMVARELGLIGGWAWAPTIDDVDRALLTPAERNGGPVVFGIPWFDAMYETDINGMVRVGGPLVGGHCLDVFGRYPNWRRQGVCYPWLNSWGPSYGTNGVGIIRRDDLAWLLERGEAALFLGRST